MNQNNLNQIYFLRRAKITNAVDDYYLDLEKDLYERSLDEPTWEEWKQICANEKDNHHNDGWTMQFYQKEYDKACKMIKEEKKNKPFDV